MSLRTIELRAVGEARPVAHGDLVGGRRRLAAWVALGEYAVLETGRHRHGTGQFGIALEDLPARRPIVLAEGVARVAHEPDGGIALLRRHGVAADRILEAAD